MKITAKHGKGTKIHIHIDGEYLLTVDEDFWFSCGLVSGDEIDNGKFAAFNEAASSRIAFNSAMNSLDYREHSVKEMRTKLGRKFDADSVESAIEKLCDLKLLDDERFAENYAHELCESKKYGKNRIKSELYKKGIDSATVNDVTENLFEKENIDIVQRIVDIIRKKYYNEMDNQKSRQKIFAALIRLGYGFSDIREAMNEFADDDYYEDF